MQDLQLIGVHEDGEHLLLSGPGDERFRMPVDDALRAAIRHDRPRLGQIQIEVDGGLRPRDVQALIRAGASADEAARRAGWSVEKVHRYEGPILAEREHVAGLAQQARLRSRSHGANSGTPTLSVRVTERLKERDVEVTDASWDSWRTEGRPWTVVLTFAAGGRQRQASWNYDLADRTVSALDDEARWLSEEVQEARGPIPAPRQQPASGRRTTVYDVEAEGGLRPGAHEEHHEDPLDLMTAMRKRSTARGRRKPGGRGGSAPASQPAASVSDDDKSGPEQATPLTPLEERHLEERRLEHRGDAGLAAMPSAADARPGTDLSDPADDPQQRRKKNTAQVGSSHRTHRLKRAAVFGDASDEDVAREDSAPEGSTKHPSRSARAHDDSAHDDSAHDDSAHDDSAHDDSAHDDSAHDDSAHDDSAHKDPAHKDPSHKDPAPEPVEKPVRQGRSKTEPKRRAREAARKTGRPSVPAWDEIMFGSRSGADRSSS